MTPAAGDAITLTGTIIHVEGTVAVVRVHRALVDADTIVVVLENPRDAEPTEEDRIRELMTEAHANPGRTITR